jgi:formyltetrahydrofolate synthetase
MSDIEIARAANKKPIQEIAAKIGISNSLEISINSCVLFPFI